MSRHQIVDSNTHRDLRVLVDHSAVLGDGVMACLTVPEEFRIVQAEFPIVFRRDLELGTFSAWALFGFEDGENLFLAGDHWQARYKPLALAIQPFLIGRSDTEVEPLTQPNFIRYTTGVRRKQWHRNCVAVGLSSGFMEPLESTSIHLIQRAVLRLIRMLPAGEISPRDVAEFNDQQFADMEQIRDFLVLHYKVTERRDSPFWRQCAAMPIPASLEQKIELFRETGRVFRRNEELFAENSWIQVMMGQGIMPESYHPVASKLGTDELDQFLTTLRTNVSQTVAQLPTHEAYLARYCAATEARAA